MENFHKRQKKKKYQNVKKSKKMKNESFTITL